LPTTSVKFHDGRNPILGIRMSRTNLGVTSR